MPARGQAGHAGDVAVLLLRAVAVAGDGAHGVDEDVTLSPCRRQPTTRRPFVVAVGDEESSAFHAQSWTLESLVDRVLVPRDED